MLWRKQRSSTQSTQADLDSVCRGRTAVAKRGVAANARVDRQEARSSRVRSRLMMSRALFCFNSFHCLHALLLWYNCGNLFELRDLHYYIFCSSQRI